MAKRIRRVGLNEISGRTINIGYTGENEHTEVVFDCTPIMGDRPNATAVLRAKPPGGEIYEPEITVEDGYVTWSPLTSDLTASGSGRYQLTFTDGEEIIKSAVGAYTINMSLQQN